MKKDVVYLCRGGYRINDNQDIQPIQVEIKGISLWKKRKLILHLPTKE